MTEDKIINGKALYSPKGAAREYGRIGCNFYTGCPHGCEYCYLKRGAPSKQLGSTEVKLKKCFKDIRDARQVLCKELEKWKDECQEHGIFLSFTTDPLIDETRELTLSAILEATIRDIPVWILTKTDSFLRDNAFMLRMQALHNFYRRHIHFGFTLTGHDELEGTAADNQARNLAMERMKSLGYSTWASIEPVISWSRSEQMIAASLPWCDHYKLGLRSGVKKTYYDASRAVKEIDYIIRKIECYGKTIYLKESVRRLLRANLFSGTYEELLSHTVDIGGNPIEHKRPIAG